MGVHPSNHYHGAAWAAIGLYQPKFEVNVGVLWRAATAFSAAYTFTIGTRISRTAPDTARSWRHAPAFSFLDVDDFLAHLPHECKLVGVEITEGAVDLTTFTHPRRCVYILGPEDGSLPTKILAACHDVVKIPTRYCLNVAQAGTIVLYDRQVQLS